MSEISILRPKTLTALLQAVILSGAITTTGAFASDNDPWVVLDESPHSAASPVLEVKSGSPKETGSPQDSPAVSLKAASPHSAASPVLSPKSGSPVETGSPQDSPAIPPKVASPRSATSPVISVKTESPRETGPAQDSPAVPPKATSPRTNVNYNNNNVDPLAAGLKKLNVLRSILANEDDYVLNDAQILTRENLTQITADLNYTLMGEVAKANLRHILGGAPLDWFTLKPLEPAQVLRLCNRMLDQKNKLTLDEVPALFGDSLSVIRWSHWHKRLTAGFVLQAAEKTGLPLIAWPDVDAFEDAVQPHFNKLPEMLKLIHGFAIAFAKEQVLPENPEQAQADDCTCGDPRCIKNIPALLKILETNNNQSAQTSRILKEGCEEFYKTLLKTTLVGAEEYLAEEERQAERARALKDAFLRTALDDDQGDFQVFSPGQPGCSVQ